MSIPVLLNIDRLFPAFKSTLCRNGTMKKSPESTSISHHDFLLATMQPWCHGIVVSLIQYFKDFMKDALFAVFPVILYDEID